MAIRVRSGVAATSGGAVTREQEVRTLNEQYIRSILTGDVAWFAVRLAEEFVCIESDGSVLDKSAFLRRTAGDASLVTYNLDEVDVRLYGDVALVRAKGSWTSKAGARGFSRYVDVYVHERNDWKVVSAQVTRPPHL